MFLVACSPGGRDAKTLQNTSAAAETTPFVYPQESEGGWSRAFDMAVDETGDLAWRDVVFSDGDDRADSAQAIALSGDGALYVGGTLHLEGVRTGWLQKRSTGGDVLWERRFGVAGERQNVSDVQVFPDGSVLVVGSHSANEDWESQTLVARRVSADGQLLWEVQPVADKQASGARAVIGDGGDIVVAFAGRPIQDAEDRDKTNISVLRLDTDGGLAWERAIGRDGQESVTGVHLDQAGGAVVTATASRGGFNRPAPMLARLSRDGDVEDVKIWRASPANVYDSELVDGDEILLVGKYSVNTLKGELWAARIDLADLSLDILGPFPEACDAFVGNAVSQGDPGVVAMETSSVRFRSGNQIKVARRF